MPDIIALGEPLFEFNRQPDGNWREGHGGDISNVAVAAARQGASAGCLTRLGADAFGESFRALWRAEGVDATHVATDRDALTGIYFVTHGPDGHHFSYRRAGSAASRMRPEDLPLDTIRGARVLHVSGISQAISESAADTVFAAIEAAREAGVTVSYDTNLRLALWPLPRARAIIQAAVAMADVALPGLDDAKRLTGIDEPDGIADFYLGLGPRVVALTLGARGVLVATPEKRRVVLAPTVEAVLDATGAGDCFDGAFLAELVAGRTPFEAAAHAVVAAALSTRDYGAIAPIPRRAEVEEFLRRRGG